RYISSQIRNLQSSAGASGINSGDRSPLARRFRMPGYPMVLISTDVFQEGEDLHTFCDAVSHYGLSASPIALEQKVGRV
ncbi:helicase-related protein, partial [Salmonella enterica]